MTKSPELTDAIKRNDHVVFLRLYLLEMKRGKSYMVPTALEYWAAREAWVDVLILFYDDFSEVFLDKLTKFWLSCVKIVGTQIDETYVDRLLGFIDNRYKELPGVKASMQPKPRVKTHSREVESTISKDYYRTKGLEMSQMPPEGRLRALVLDGVQHSNAEFFVLHMVILSTVDDTISLPRSSVMDDIRSLWQSLLDHRFGVEVDQVFLDEVCVLWFYLVNQYGITFDDVWIQKVVQYLLATYEHLELYGSAATKKAYKGISGDGVLGMLSRFLQSFR